MEIKSKVIVTVLGNSEGEICRGGWGPRRSSEETTEITKGLLGRLYGDQVIIEYYDMAKADDFKRNSELLAKVPENRMYYPLVFVGDELKIVGSAEYYQILYTVRELVEA